jgi:hypothetical protein
MHLGNNELRLCKSIVLVTLKLIKASIKANLQERKATIILHIYNALSLLCIDFCK